MAGAQTCLGVEFLSRVLARPVAAVQEKTIGSLWAGYGTVSQLKLTWAEPRTSETLVLKRVQPPKSAGTSHERKLKSYEVETTFYKDVATTVLKYARSTLPKPFYVDCQPGQSFTLLLSDLRVGFPRQLDDYDLKATKAALDWLAEFHAFFWEKDLQPGLWDQGCYWHLDTRMDEWSQIPPEWKELKNVASVLDQRLKGVSSSGQVDERHRTLLHGDFKSENILFAEDGTACAAYDFQYCGAGFGVRDVVYLFCSSVQASTLSKHEQQLLAYYHEKLLSCIKQHNPSHSPYPFELLLSHYNLCFLDYVRFMAGWGFWGNTRWAQAKARALLKEPQLWS